MGIIHMAKRQNSPRSTKVPRVAKKAGTPFETALMEFAQAVTEAFEQNLDFQPEDQLKAPIKTLFIAAGKAFGYAVHAATEVHAPEQHGRPDVGVTVEKLLVGHAELKAPGKGADPTLFKGQNKAQWDKFKDLPNLIYTDGNDWAMYRSGERVGPIVRLDGDVTKDGAAVVDAQNAQALATLLRDFLLWAPIVPSGPRPLANLLAPLCRLLRASVSEAMTDPTSPLVSLAEDWRKYLFPDATADEFADAYAQTLTYALLLAQLSGASELSTTSASKTIRPGHRLLADAFRILSDESVREQLELPTGLLERVIGAVDFKKLKTKSSGDPWLYFYEDFLAAYDPEMRKQLGVYYTPVQVVRCQVRLISTLLAEHFDAEFAFVDPKVMTLDPAGGTGTYSLAAVQHSLDLVEAKKGEEMRASAATTAAKNIHSFELLVGPYAVAHLRLTQQILAEGGTIPEDGVHVYLTDTLESPHAVPPGYLPLACKTLSDEQKRARRVKAETRVLVCLGNPPYDREEREVEPKAGERRKGGWIRFGNEERDGDGILRDFLEPLADTQGGVHAKNLYNDYVYFWRWALWKVFEAPSSVGPGIVSFITAASYLRGPGFAGMRKVMRQTFDELWIVDLEGGKLGARKTENVFAIQTPVAIAVGVRYASSKKTKSAAIVRYAKIEGTRDAKLATLDEVLTFADLRWTKCPTGWVEPFLPPLPRPYASWPRLTDLFPWQENGMQFKRSWPIGEDADVLQRRWRKLVSSPGGERGKLFRETDGRKIVKQYPSLDGSGVKAPSVVNTTASSQSPNIARFGFRSFDRQWAIMDGRVADRPRPALHVAHGPKQVYLTSFLSEVVGEGPAAVATGLIPDLHVFRGSFGGAHIIPLYRDPAGTVQNVTKGVTDVLSKTYGLGVAAEDLFAYCYLVLATPAYARTFWQELLQPPPRIPMTADAKLFERAVKLGRRLLWLHTFGERLAPPGKKVGQVPKGIATCKVGTPGTAADYPQTFSYDERNQELHVGKGIFAQVRREVWEFSVSGYPVVSGWLGLRMKVRAGKKSSALDELRPLSWHFDDELLELLWVLDFTVDERPDAGDVFEAIRRSTLLQNSAFPVPSEEERKAPANDLQDDRQPQLSGISLPGSTQKRRKKQE